MFCWFESGKKSDQGVNLIASLCEKYHTSEDELSKALEKTNTLIINILKNKPCSASECQQDNLSFIDPGIDLQCKTYCLVFTVFSRAYLLPLLIKISSLMQKV